MKSEAFWRVVARLSLQAAGTAEFCPANVEFRIEIIQSEPILRQRLFLRHSLFDILRFSASRGITLSRNLCTAADVTRLPSVFDLRTTPLPPNTRRIIDQEIAWAAGCVIRIGICGGGRSGLHLAGIDRASSMQFAHQAGCRGSAVAAAIAAATCDATRAGGH